MSKALEALERIKNAPTIYVGCASDIYTRYSFECKTIEKELVLLEALRNKLDRKVESKEYHHEESNAYRLSTLLTYELREQWNEKEIECLRQFLLNLSGIQKKLKALEIIKEKNVRINLLRFSEYLKTYNYVVMYEYPPDMLTKEEYDLLKEIL